MIFEDVEDPQRLREAKNGEMLRWNGAVGGEELGVGKQ